MVVMEGMQVLTGIVLVTTINPEHSLIAGWGCTVGLWIVGEEIRSNILDTEMFALKSGERLTTSYHVKNSILKPSLGCQNQTGWVFANALRNSVLYILQVPPATIYSLWLRDSDKKQGILKSRQGSP